MGSDSNSNLYSASVPSVSSSSSSSPSTTASPNAKRSRDPEDELYVDNLHSHKRYLSEIMASSLNGLTVGDPLPDNLMESPARSESMFYFRDEMLLQYSPMSEDSDDSRFSETSLNNCSSQIESLFSLPVSPYKYQKPFVGGPSAPAASSYPSHGSIVAGVTSSQPRQRGSDSEGRFPSSPSDICHSADLRRAALLRSVQMRTQSPGASPSDFQFSPGQEPMPSIETEERHCSYMKSLPYEREYQIDECSAMGVSEHEFIEERSCEESDTELKKENPGG